MLRDEQGLAGQLQLDFFPKSYRADERPLVAYSNIRPDIRKGGGTVAPLQAVGPRQGRFGYYKRQTKLGNGFVPEVFHVPGKSWPVFSGADKDFVVRSLLGAKEEGPWSWVASREDNVELIFPYDLLSSPRSMQCGLNLDCQGTFYNREVKETARVPFEEAERIESDGGQGHAMIVVPEFWQERQQQQTHGAPVM